MLINIIKMLIPLLIVVLSFIYHIGLGFVALLLYIAYSLYQSRVDLYAAIGNKNYVKGDTEAALKWLKKSYETNPNRTKYATAYGYVLLKLGNVEEAKHRFEELLKVDPLPRGDEMKLKINLAIISWKQGHTDEAINTT